MPSGSTRLRARHLGVSAQWGRGDLTWRARRRDPPGARRLVVPSHARAARLPWRPAGEWVWPCADEDVSASRPAITWEKTPESATQPAIITTADPPRRVKATAARGPNDEPFSRQDTTCSSHLPQRDAAREVARTAGREGVDDAAVGHDLDAAGSAVAGLRKRGSVGCRTACLRAAARSSQRANSGHRARVPRGLGSARFTPSDRRDVPYGETAPRRSRTAQPGLLVAC